MSHKPLRSLTPVAWNLATTLMICITVFHAGTANTASCRQPNMTATQPRSFMIF